MRGRGRKLHFPATRLLQAVPTEVVAFTTLLATALGTVFAPINLLLLLLWVVAVLLDQASGMIKAYLTTPAGEAWFRGDIAAQGFAKKGLVAVGFAVAGSVDVALLHLGNMGAAVGDLTPITKGALAYALIAVWGSILKNVAIVKEARGMVEFILRRADAAKLGHEPPVRRSYDPIAVAMEHELTTTDGRPFSDAVQEKDRAEEEGRKP